MTALPGIHIEPRFSSLTERPFSAQDFDLALPELVDPDLCPGQIRGNSATSVSSVL
jgi:hypothetical protein